MSLGFLHFRWKLAALAKGLEIMRSLFHWMFSRFQHGAPSLRRRSQLGMRLRRLELLEPRNLLAADLAPTQLLVQFNKDFVTLANFGIARRRQRVRASSGASSGATTTSCVASLEPSSRTAMPLPQNRVVRCARCLPPTVSTHGGQTPSGASGARHHTAAHVCLIVTT